MSNSIAETQSGQLAYQQVRTLTGASPMNGASSDAFGVPSPVEFFVPPQFERIQFTSNPGSILISARGAAGKSHVAKQLALDLQTPLWDLARDTTVNAGSLDARLVKYLHEIDVVPAIQALARPWVVIDAVDEARTRVSGESWREFLASLQTWSQSGLGFAVFGRERSLLEVADVLIDTVDSLAWLELSHFAASEQRQYIDLAAKARNSALDTRNVVYEQARDSILKKFEGTLGATNVDAFAGYPPVLDAIGVYLADAKNLLVIKSRFDAESGNSTSLAVLTKVIEDLLDREQSKVVDMDNTSGVVPSTRYSRAEQLDWLRCELEGGPLPTLADFANDADRTAYVEATQDFRANHPFRTEGRWSSPVFACYAAALDLDGFFSHKRLLEVAHSSSLLFDFCAARREQLIVDEHVLAALHTSVLAAESGQATAVVQVAGEPGHGAQELFTATLGLSQAVGAESTIIAQVLTDTPGTLVVYGPLESITVNIEGQVICRAGADGQTVLGPDLYINATEVVIEGAVADFANPTRRFEGISSGDTGVVIEAISKLVLPPTIGARPQNGQLELRVPQTVTLQYPWHTFSEELVSPTAAPDDRAVRFLNMFMNLTRAHGRDSQGVYLKKLGGRQSVSGEELDRVVESLSKMGVVARSGDGNIVVLKPAWESRSFVGKQVDGQRTLSDPAVLAEWRPVLEAVAAELRR